MKKVDGKQAPASKGNAKKVAAKAVVAAPVVRKSPKKRKPEAATLSSADRLAKLKPPENYSNILKQVVESWTDHKAIIRIEGRTPGRLGGLFEKAKKVRAKEDALRKTYEKELHKLVDARLLVEAEMWSQALDVYRVAKAMTPIRPELEKAFDKMTDHFSRPGRTPAPSTPPPPGVGILRDADLEDE